MDQAPCGWFLEHQWVVSKIVIGFLNAGDRRSRVSIVEAESSGNKGWGKVDCRRGPSSRYACNTSKECCKKLRTHTMKKQARRLTGKTGISTDGEEGAMVGHRILSLIPGDLEGDDACGWYWWQKEDDSVLLVVFPCSGRRWSGRMVVEYGGGQEREERSGGSEREAKGDL